MERGMDGIKALAFDTGGTILDWHGGLVAGLTEYGEHHGVAHDWDEFANEYRRRALRRMLGSLDPSFNIDDVHREVLDELIREHAIDAFSDANCRDIAGRWHALDAWPDFVPALQRLRRRYVCVSFTILSLGLVIDVSRRNGIDWDAVICCEMLRVYKPRPEAYRRAAALLQLPPENILMVACHNFDLDAARSGGYRTAFVHRPAEWGPAGPPDPIPNPATDIFVPGFAELAERLGA
jgi:2-haloacid dehalogenase